MKIYWFLYLHSVFAFFPSLTTQITIQIYSMQQIILREWKIYHAEGKFEGAMFSELS